MSNCKSTPTPVITGLKLSKDDEVYVEQPQDYEVLGQEHNVYMIKKALYGLKQDLRAQYSSIDSYLIENEFHRSESEPTLYTKVNDKVKMLIVLSYVDDLIFTSDLAQQILNQSWKLNFK